MCESDMVSKCQTYSCLWVFAPRSKATMQYNVSLGCLVVRIHSMLWLAGLSCQASGFVIQGFCLA